MELKGGGKKPMSGCLLVVLGVLVCLGTGNVSAPPVAFAAEEDVLLLDVTNYTDVVNDHSFIVVAFVAPWCKYSKKLKAPYDAAALLLKGDLPKITLARIDASDEDNRPIALMNDINNFPTVKIFKNGKFFTQYDGPTDTEGMVSYLRRLAGPASVEITERAQATELLEKNPVAAIGVFNKLEGKEFAAFMEIAEEVRMEIPFVHTTNVALLGVKGGPFRLSPPGFRLYTAFDKEVYDSVEFDVEKMRQFVNEMSTPRVISVTRDPKMGGFVMKSFDSDEPKVFAFVNGNAEEGIKITSAIKVEADGSSAKSFRFITCDAGENPEALHYYGIRHEDIPAVLIHDTGKEKKYLLPNATIAAIPYFLEDFRAGKLVELIKSQPIPEKDDDTVKIVVTKNFDVVVKQSGKNVLILFYAPWCNQCKRLMPTYEEVAREYQDDDDLIVAKFDATANDIIDKKKFSVRSYPTIYLRSSMGVVTWYVGKGDKDDLMAFVEMHRGEGLGDMDGEEQILDSVAYNPPKDEL